MIPETMSTFFCEIFILCFYYEALHVESYLALSLFFFFFFFFLLLLLFFCFFLLCFLLLLLLFLLLLLLFLLFVFFGGGDFFFFFFFFFFQSCLMLKCTLGEERVGLYASPAFVSCVLYCFALFRLGVGVWLRIKAMAHPGLFI